MNKSDYEDDGRVVADMSGVEKPSYGAAWIGKRAAARLGADDLDRRRAKGEVHVDMESSERRAAIFGALGASLLIGIIFIAAAGLLIAVLLFLWKAW